MSVLNDFTEAIEIQQRKEDEAYEEQTRLPIDERVSQGVTMTNLRVVFDFHDYPPSRYCWPLDHPNKYIRSAKVDCYNNISKFREGNQVMLSNDSVSFKMNIITDTLEEFILAPSDYDRDTTYIDSENYNENNWEINVVKSDLTLKLLSATASHLMLDDSRLNHIEQLLAGELENVRSSDFSYSQLNPSQNAAVERAINSSSFHIIQGPPGTGKTKTIAHITKILVEQGKKVFITAFTHTAINNCLNAISEEVKDASKVVKIGDEHGATEILDNSYITRKTRLPLDTYAFASDVSQDGIIIGGTSYCMCYPASKRLEDWEFDVAIIDEAAQMSIPLAVAVMSHADKTLLIGDHKQLDPIMPSGTGSSMFSESVFRRLVRLYPNDTSLLNTSYRLNDQLIRIPNALFYDNELISDTSLKRVAQQLSIENYSTTLNHQDSKVLYLHQEFDGLGRSPYEANIVAGMVSDLLANGISFSDIGIITPYRAQVREIKKALNEALDSIDTEETEALFIDTVDRMQGQERDYIIYSMSNSHPLESKRRLDFFYSPNRLNVAITRAIIKCIVIANYKVFDIVDEEIADIPDFSKLKTDLDIFKQYFKLSSKIYDVINEGDW